MNKWLFLVAAFGGLMACSDQDADFGGEDAPEMQAQTATADSGASSATPTRPVTTPSGIDGSIGVTSSADAGAASTEPPKGSTSAACMADSDCTAPGTKCVKSVNIPIGGLTIDFAGGYCTKNCTADSECGPGAGCPLAMAAAFLPEISQCLKQCTQASECRAGYSCQALPSFPGFGGAPAAGPAAAPKQHCLPPLPFPSGGGGFPGGGFPGGGFPGGAAPAATK